MKMNKLVVYISVAMTIGIVCGCVFYLSCSKDVSTKSCSNISSRSSIPGYLRVKYSKKPDSFIRLDFSKQDSEVVKDIVDYLLENTSDVGVDIVDPILPPILDRQVDVFDALSINLKLELTTINGFYGFIKRLSGEYELLHQNNSKWEIVEKSNEIKKLIIKYAKILIENERLILDAHP